MSQKLAIFDWDGTIMDSISRIVDSMRSAAALANLSVPTEQAVKDSIGLSLPPAFNLLFGELTSDQVSLMRNCYQQEYLDDRHGDTPVFADVEQVLSTLTQRGYLLAVATGKSRAGLDRMFQLTGLKHYFSDSMTSDQAASKPGPEMINILLERLNVAPLDAVMIGDSTLDMQMANNANISAIGVSYGAHSADALSQYQPMAIVDAPLQLLAHLSGR